MTDTVKRALESVIRAQRNLEEARDRLASAGDWGLFDLLGGGFISGLIKHSRIDDADSLVASAQSQLENARHILQSAPVDLSLTEGEISSAARFFDLFADGLFADLWMQSKIDRRRQAVEEMLHKVRQLRCALEKM